VIKCREDLERVTNIDNQITLNGISRSLHCHIIAVLKQIKTILSRICETSGKTKKK
jgi:hypothetical protein